MRWNSEALNCWLNSIKIVRCPWLAIHIVLVASNILEILRGKPLAADPQQD